MNEVFISYLALPMSVNGLVTPTPDGDYQVILNARHSPQMQRETYRHELRHILMGHFSQDAEALAPLERAASLTRLPGEEEPRKARLEEAIRRAEDSGLSSADFAVEKPQPNNEAIAVQKKFAVNPPLERKRAGMKPAKAKPAKAPPPPPAQGPPAAPGTALLRAVRAQLTGLHY